MQIYQTLYHLLYKLYYLSMEKILKVVQQIILKIFKSLCKLKWKFYIIEALAFWRLCQTEMVRTSLPISLLNQNINDLRWYVFSSVCTYSRGHLETTTFREISCQVLLGSKGKDSVPTFGLCCWITDEQAFHKITKQWQSLLVKLQKTTSSLLKLISENCNCNITSPQVTSIQWQVPK